MEVLAFLLALIAVALAAVAFARTGGMKDLRRQIDELAPKAETAREKTANVLGRLQKIVRGKERASSAEKRKQGRGSKAGGKGNSGGAKGRRSGTEGSR